MAEKDLIAKIRELRQIRPRKDWVFLTKQEILGPEELKPSLGSQILSIFPSFNYKPIFATITLLVVLTGLFGFTQNSLPGDLLYPIKRVIEKSQAVFVSEENKPNLNLELANKRLEELSRIAQTNQVKKLAPALKEYQASLAEAAKNIAQVAATTSDASIIKKIAGQIQKLEENREKLEKTYGIAGLETEEETNPTKVIVEWLIKDLEERTLTEEQQLLFEGARESYLAGDYNLALEEIIKLSEPQE